MWAGWFRVGTPNDAPVPAGPTPVRESPAAPDDPRLTFATEFRNVRPGVKYLGDSACAACHAATVRSYHAHPMGRSAEWVGRAAATDHAAGANNPFTVSGLSLGLERKADRVWHFVGVAGRDGDGPRYAAPADLSIGSGTHGRSYLTVDRGAVWQSPVSWFGQAHRWDVSPGFDLGQELRRPIVARCLHCHTAGPEPIPDAVNRYREPLLPVQASIGCERCHGPGELHVAERTAGGERPGPDHSIVNPARLSPELKLDVCRQCHLSGAVQVARRGRDGTEFRPGLPWERFVSTFLRHPDVTDYLKSVGQFEQMEMSRCFAGGNLSCTSCHDPHAKPAADEAAARYRAKCLSCHGSRPCALPEPQRRARDDACTACHMPARDSSNVVHVAITDHRISRRPEPGRSRAAALPPGAMPLVGYRAGPHAPSAEERERDRMIALGNEFGRGGATPDRLRTVADGLDRALGRWADDGAAWVARSRVHQARGEVARAVAAARSAVALNPASEAALVQLAGAAVAARDYESAVRAADTLIALNPSSADHVLTRASALFGLHDWVRAEADARAALAIQPVQPKARLIVAVCRHHLGDPAAGRRELELALALAPSFELRAALAASYAQSTR